MSAVRGWCPSAHRPMQSGDGLLVRVQPRLAWLSADDLLLICDLSERFGNGVIDLTSRANLQLRGVGTDDHAPLLQALIGAGLVAADPRAERPITVAPAVTRDSRTARVADAIYAAMTDLPELPGKMGTVVDAEETRVLSDVSGDFRFEGCANGLILRADGVPRGRPVDERNAVQALTDLAIWFLDTGGPGAGRMARHVATKTLPPEWQTVEPAPASKPMLPDVSVGHLGFTFGQVAAGVLNKIIVKSDIYGAYLTPWRSMIFRSRVVDVPPPSRGASVHQADIQVPLDSLTDVSDAMTDISAGRANISDLNPDISIVASEDRDLPTDILLSPRGALCSALKDVGIDVAGLVTHASDPRLSVDACPGAPQCASALAATRPVAQQLAGRVEGWLHVSGCAKGCARARPADVTLVGTASGFDLVIQGRAGDTPRVRDVDIETLPELLEQLG